MARINFLLNYISAGDNIPQQHLVVFIHFWKCKVLSKVLACSWRFQLRKIYCAETSSLICKGYHAFYAFIKLRVSTTYFSLVRFLNKFGPGICMDGNYSALPYDAVTHYLQHNSTHKGKKVRNLRHIIWHAVTWSIWLLHNHIVFQGGLVDLVRILYLIKVRSCSWLMETSPCYPDTPLQCLKASYVVIAVFGAEPSPY
ncbi:hypothetical protein CR513_38116, partial [Mucuna pruriens]